MGSGGRAKVKLKKKPLLWFHFQEGEVEEGEEGGQFDFEHIRCWGAIRAARGGTENSALHF